MGAFCTQQEARPAPSVTPRFINSGVRRQCHHVEHSTEWWMKFWYDFLPFRVIEDREVCHLLRLSVLIKARSLVLGMLVTLPFSGGYSHL